MTPVAAAGQPCRDDAAPRAPRATRARAHSRARARPAARVLRSPGAMSHFHEALRKPQGLLLIGAVACAIAWAIWTFVVW